MQIVYTPEATKHLDFWVKSGNKAILKKILELSEAILLNPAEGVGKPEQLKHDLAGYWSRRITQEHRMVYKIEEDNIYIYSLKGHYE